MTNFSRTILSELSQESIFSTSSNMGALTSLPPPGIQRRKLKKIFEEFYPIDDEMTRTTRGTGIGLALLKMLADAMGAHVDVANRRPGTEFSLRFPTA
ncbi:ATP-binding protein [Acidobacteria bacterium AH-259-D05]|nr:ATP-binding protein [Acidobacteria bacterium AH-259-D05]